jgi:histidinol-phosphate aminotransferase
VSRFRKPSLEGFEPYVPGLQPADGERWVKLNTNESPLPPSPNVATAIAAAAADLRLYPDPTQRALREAIADACDVSPEQVVGGNGGDEVLAMAVRAFVPRGGRAAFLTPSYSLVPALLGINDVEAEPHPYEPDFTLPASFLASDAPLRFVTNPNSPSGTLLPPEAVDEVCARASGVVVVDEAYVDFAPRSCLELLPRHGNLLLLRTLSKSYALAGLRLGFALGAPELIADVVTVKDDYNLGRLQLAAGVAAVGDREHQRRIVRLVVESRERLTDELRRRDWNVLPSGANFVFAIPPRPAREVYEGLLARRVLVRFFDRPGVDHGLRISVGTWDDCQALLAAIDSL